METYARVFPIKSKEALLELGRAVDEWSGQQKAAFFEAFGRGRERWYYQEIDGRPYVVSVAEAERLEAGFRWYATTQDPFSAWLRERVVALTDVDMSSKPKGPEAEFVYELRP